MNHVNEDDTTCSGPVAADPAAVGPAGDPVSSPSRSAAVVPLADSAAPRSAGELLPAPGISPEPCVLAEATIETLAARVRAWGCKPSHAAPLLRSFYARDGEASLPTGLWPEELRRRWPVECVAGTSLPGLRQASADGTVKLLRRLHDGRSVECVLMPDHRADRAAGCVSSQVGCAMGCDFCATTKTGFERNLTSGEIVEQFLALRREARAAGRRLQTLVFMGMGEPMLNLDAVLAAVERIAANGLGGLGWRQVTISTVGVIAGIERLADSGLGVHLAISLHAPDDATRAALLPVGRRQRLEDIMAAADAYQAKTGRPVTLQYCLLRGVNDSDAHAAALAALVGRRRMHVNLLRYNPTGPSLLGRHYEPTPVEGEERFVAHLRAAAVVAHIRRSRGPEIDAACGQLRRRTLPGGDSAAGSG
jgi:23S rRNA (adenine2503-C2)-methyltransferase